MLRAVIVFAVVLVVAIFAWPWLESMGLGRLPGDLVLEYENIRIYLPITTAFVVSIGALIILRLFSGGGTS